MRPTGFTRITSGFALVSETSEYTVFTRSAMPSSCAHTMTLRTKGERGDQKSFMGSSTDLGTAVVQDSDVTLGHARAEADDRPVDPHFGAYGLAGVDR